MVEDNKNNEKLHTPKLILLEDFVEQRVRKEKEIEWYDKQLKEIERKLFWLRKEQQLTVTIIDMLTKEKVYIVKDEMEKRMLEDKDD